MIVYFINYSVAFPLTGYTFYGKWSVDVEININTAKNRYFVFLYAKRVKRSGGQKTTLCKVRDIYKGYIYVIWLT